jgi:hypothetical protein
MRTAQALLSDVNLRLTPRAWAQLSHGEVDSAAMAYLQDLLARHVVEVSTFPQDAPSAAAAAPFRTAAITALDGRIVSARPRQQAATSALLRLPGVQVLTGSDRGRPAVLVRALLSSSPR